MSFTDEEIAYLRTQPIARIATLSADGQPDVVPVGFEFDDMVSFDPFIARGMRIYGRAEQPFERVGMVGPGIYMRIEPTISWSWNLAGDPVGDTWYGARRTVHQSPTRT